MSATRPGAPEFPPREAVTHREVADLLYQLAHFIHCEAHRAHAMEFDGANALEERASEVQRLANRFWEAKGTALNGEGFSQ